MISLIKQSNFNVNSKERKELPKVHKFIDENGIRSVRIGDILLPHYSVLMAVCDNDSPDKFHKSVESMLLQTYEPAEIVIVCDGELTSSLEIMTQAFDEKNIRIVKNNQKKGAAAAFNIGLQYCKYEYIVKMDSDDISVPERCMQLMTLFAVKPELDIIGSYVQEFMEVRDDDRDEPVKKLLDIKEVPILHDDIIKYSKKRNPFNRQSVAFKKSMAQKVRGYSEIELCEDYEFAAKMLREGAKAQNIPQVLVLYRLGDNYIPVRKSWKLTKGFICVRWRIFLMGYTNLWEFIQPCVLQLGLYIFPVRFTRWVYKKFLRKPVDTADKK